MIRIAGYALVLLSTSAYPALLAENNPAPPDPILLELKSKLETGLKNLKPAPTYKFPEKDKGKKLEVDFRTRIYKVHTMLKKGDYAQNTKQVKGPKMGGFMMTLSVVPEKLIFQKTYPSVIREPYWYTYQNVFSYKNQKIFIRLSYICHFKYPNMLKDIEKSLSQPDIAKLQRKLIKPSFSYMGSP